MSEWRQIYALLSKTAQRRLWLLLALMLLGSFAEMLSLGAVIPFMTLLVAPETAYRLPMVGDLLSDQPEQQVIWIVGGGFLLALFGATLMRIWLLHASNQFAHRTGYELSTQAFKTLLAQPYVWHVQHNSSHQLAQLNRVSAFISQNVQPLLVLVTSAVLGIGILAVLLASEPTIMILMTLFVAIFYTATLYLVRQKLARNGQTLNSASTTKNRLLQESLGGIRDVILDHSQQVQTSGFAVVEMQVRQALIVNEWVAQLPRYLVEFFGIVTIVLLALALTNNGDTPVATLGLLALGSQRLLPLAQKIYESLNTLRVAQAARQDVLSLLALPRELLPEPEQPLPFNQQLNLHDVSFRYPSSPSWVLDHVSLSIRRGERVGIVGPSGGGKSTLMDLMMGLLEPQQGNLAVDGQVLTQELLPSWRQRIAHVPQAIFLLDASLRENIALGVPEPEINEARLLRCIVQAQLRTVLEHLPQGVNTLVGERGVLLSGGQRQRIGIARALYRKADVLVMDEATSALDNHTEAEVIEAIRNLGPSITIIMIAHRLTTLSFCDRILHFEGGQLVKSSHYNDIKST